MSGGSGIPPPRGYRFPAGVPATVDQGGRSIPCEAQNLSRSGVLLTGRFAEPAAHTLDITLKSPNGTLEIRMAGRLVRADHDSTSGDTQLAVEFTDVDDHRRDALEIFIARMLESPAPGALDDLKPGSPPHEIKQALESIPIPQRIVMAHKAELKQREILRQDQHPAVLDALVRNSSFTLPEARALATSPFLQSGTIDLLANDPRFRADVEYRMLLATHPRVSTLTAEKLTADFVGPQLKRLLARPGLNQLLREKLLKKLMRG